MRARPRRHVALLATLLGLAVPHATTAQDSRAAGRDDAVVSATSRDPAVHADSQRFETLHALVDRALVSSQTVEYDRLLSFLDRELTRAPDDPVLHHYRGFALFRKASVLATMNDAITDAVSAGDVADGIATDDGTIKAMFEAADRALERAAKGLDWPESLALRSAAVGQLIAYGGPLAGLRQGPRSMRLLDAALASGPDNPRVWMLRGISDLYKPRLMGGSVKKAEASLRRALSLFATDAPAAPAPWWGHAETHGWLGHTLEKQGKLTEARAAYAEALALEPKNAWVREVLLPALDKVTR